MGSNNPNVTARWPRRKQVVTISERGYESAQPHVRAILDGRGRIMVRMSHDTDLADGWERDGEDDNFIASFSPGAYAIGINVAIWALTR